MKKQRKILGRGSSFMKECIKHCIKMRAILISKLSTSVKVYRSIRLMAILLRRS